MSFSYNPLFYDLAECISAAGNHQASCGQRNNLLKRPGHERTTTPFIFPVNRDRYLLIPDESTLCSVVGKALLSGSAAGAGVKMD
jgi:hypothetical protein